MRTQLLLATAALAALGALSASAQVYSVNAVGYVNVTAPANKFALVANQLTASPNNTVSNVFAGVPEGTFVYTWTGTQFLISAFELGEWTNPTADVGPGKGAFVLNRGSAVNVTFVGEVPQGSLQTAYTAGFNMVASKVPQAGNLQTVLGFVPGEGDTVLTWSVANQKYNLFTYEFGEWAPAPGPVLAVGEGFFLNAKAAGSWNRTFSVN
ncbi:MAG: hypothetical protein ACKVYV_18570 [Limisphaerales bacterium]